MHYFRFNEASTQLRALCCALLFFFCPWAHAQGCSSITAGNQKQTEIKFGEFFKNPIGPAGLELTETIRETNRKPVCITGYMVKQEAPPVGRFFLTPLALETHEHADGEADDLPASTVLVYLADSQKDLTIPHTSGLIAIQGMLNVGRREDEEGRISWIQVQLSPSGIRPLTQAPTDTNHGSHRH